MKTRIAPVILLAIMGTPTCVAQDRAKDRAADRSAAVVPAGPGALIYCDQSPGAVLHGLVWHRVFESSGKSVTFVTDPTEFAARLSGGPWSRVTVLARYAPGRPSYAKALRDYVSRDTGNHVLMLLWHDNGTRPTADTVVFATMAIVQWSRGWDQGMTTIGYSGIANTDPEAHKTRTTQGYQFPDFQGIKAKNPTVHFHLSEATARALPDDQPIPPEALISTAAQPDCEENCRLTFIAELAVCDKNRDTQTQQCDDLYGPSPGDPGDPDAYLQCITDANDSHSACLKSATQRYNNCMALCAMGT